MKRRIIVGVVIALLLCTSFGAFAASNHYPWMASYNKPGQFNVYASVGFYGYYGLEGSVGAEYIMGAFDIAGIPLQWGIMGRGNLAFPVFVSGGTWLDWGAAPLVSLHWGVTFEKNLKFDFYISLGLGFYGTTGTYWDYDGFGFGAASFTGAMWKFSDNIALLAEFGYIGWTSIYGVGVQIKF